MKFQDEDMEQALQGLDKAISAVQDLHQGAKSEESEKLLNYYCQLAKAIKEAKTIIMPKMS